MVLEETGVRCQNEDVRRIFEETGLAANDETTGHIHVLPALVAQALTTVPKRQDFFVPENASESVEAFAELRRLGSRLPRLVIISQEERIRQAREKILFNFSVSELLVLRSQFGAPIADLHLPFALNAVGAALAAIWKKSPWNEASREAKTYQTKTPTAFYAPAIWCLNWTRSSWRVKLRRWIDLTLFLRYWGPFAVQNRSKRLSKSSSLHGATGRHSGGKSAW